MSKFISLNANGGTAGARKERTSALAALLAEQTGRTSFESSSDDFGTSSMESVASELLHVFEGGAAAPSTTKNPAGLAMASFVASLGNNAGPYMQDYSKESAVSGHQAFTMEGGHESAYSPESFDNQVLGQYRNLSVELNYNIGRQMDAMELMYRTVAVHPDQGGVRVDIPNLFIQNVLERQLSGRPTDFDYRRALDAYIDPAILADDGVQLIPTHNTETAKHFVEPAVAGTWEVQQGQRKVTTGYLKTAKEVDILAIGHLDRVSRVGNPDFTDALDRSAGIAALLMDIDGVKLDWQVKGQPYTRFVPSVEHGARRMVMDYLSRSLTLTADSVDMNGDAITAGWFSTIVDNDLRVRLKVTASGEVDVEKGNIILNPSAVSVSSIEDANGELVSLEDPSVATLVEKIEGARIPGWVPDTRVTNSNVRHIGMLIAHRATKEILVTRTRAPFFYAFPGNEERDVSPAEDMASVVRAYTNNEGIAHMMGFHERAMQQTGGVRGTLTKGNFEDNNLTVEGLARYLVNPYLQHYKVNVKELLQSTETQFNLKNGKEVILNQLRAVAFDILQTTNIENAARMLDGGEIKHPLKFALVTSKELEYFLTVEGDSRTLGAGLDYVIASDVNQNLKGKMYIGIVRDTPGNEIDLLSNGVCLQTPTMVTEVTSWRQNRQVKELLIQPRFNHYQLLPIMVRLDIEGVDELLQQLAPFRVNNKQIDGEAGTGDGGTGSNPPVGPGTGGDDGDTGAGTAP